MRAGRALGSCSCVALASPCAPLCNLFRSVGRVGSLPLWSVPLRGLAAVAPPLLDGRSVGSVCCGCPRSYLFCGGAFPAPLAVSRNTLAPMAAWAFPPVWLTLALPPPRACSLSPLPSVGAVRFPLARAGSLHRVACSGGCPCRAPAPGAAGAPGGTPPPLLRRGRGSRFARHSGVPPGVFFGWRVVLRAGWQGVSPRCGCPRFATLPPCPNARHLCDIFCLARGARVAPCPARGLRPCARRGGRVRRPPAPPATPTRGAVFFIVLCSVEICNFAAISQLRRIKKHK